MPDPKNKYQPGTSETATNLGRNLATYFLGVKNTSLKPSSYRPAKAKDPNAKYNTWQYLKNDVKTDITGETYLNNINTREANLSKQNKKYLPNYVTEGNFDQLYNYYENAKNANTVSGSSVNLGHYQVSAGKDDRGRYFGIYDKYDWNLLEGVGLKGNSWETYDRIYEDEWDSIKDNKKMPDGGKLNKMPDPKKIAVNDYEAARAARILELSRQWGVPTRDIFSKVKKGPKSYGVDDQGQQRQLGEYTDFYTFDAQGNVNRTLRDQNEPQGTVPYTPEDIALQQKYPGIGATTRNMNPTGGVPIAQARVQQSYRFGGLLGTQEYRSPLQTANMYNSGGQIQFREGSAFPDDTPVYTHDWSNGQLGRGGIPPKVYDNGGQMFREGSMFPQDVPPNYGPNFPPKVYNFGGGINYFGPTPKLKNSNRPAQPQTYNTKFSADPFPNNYSTWDSPYAQNSYRSTFEMGGPISYDPTSYLEPDFEIPTADSGIRIKPENRGKFTAAANRAGMGVQEYARKVLADPNASGTLKKRANFARNAAKWNRYGGVAQFGDSYPQYPSADFPGAVSTEENPIYYQEPEQRLPINTPMQQSPQDNQARGGFQASMSLGTMGPIMGASAAIGQMAGQQSAARDSATQKRKNITSGPYYNPYSYGSGATNLYEGGGKIKRTNKMTLADAMNVIRDHGYDIQID